MRERDLVRVAASASRPRSSGAVARRVSGLSVGIALALTLSSRAQNRLLLSRGRVGALVNPRFTSYGGQPAPAPGGGSFADDFTSLANFLLEQPFGSITVSGGEVLMQSGADQPVRAWQNINQIPANWRTITVTIDCKVQSAGNVSRPLLALCFDASPAGNPSTAGDSSGTPMQNGYASQVFGDGAADPVGRFVAGSAALLANTNVYDWTAGTWHTYKLVFTKTPTAITIQRHVDGVAVGSLITDNDASRHTGPCWVGFAGRASGGWQMWYRSLSVQWT